MSGRYDELPRLDIADADGGTRRMSAPRIAPRRPAGSHHLVRSHDRLDLLALAALGDGTAWWILADANPEADALRLEQPGTELAVPDA